MSNNEAYGKFDIEGKITFPKEIIEEVAAEIPEKPLPWGWIFMAGSIISFIICLAVKK